MSAQQKWAEWEKELLERARDWEQDPTLEQPETSVLWDVIGTSIIVASAGMVVWAIWAVLR
jgi:hypothetical protein